MAVGDIRLSTNRYVRPDTYIGRVHQPAPAALTGTPRFPCYIGKGSRLAREANSRHIRSRVYAEGLNFSTAPPYVAPLDHNAANDQTLSQVQKTSGEPVPFASWRFTESVVDSGVYNQVQIDDTVFDNNAAYVAEYQSVDRDVQDELQFDDIREVLLLGDAENSARYVEFADFRIVTVLTGDDNDADALVANAANTYTSAATAIAATVGPASTGTTTIDASTAYAWDYDRTYLITCTASAGASPNRTAEFSVAVSATSGGNSQTTNLPFHTSATTPVIQIAEAAGSEANVELDNNTHYKAGSLLPAWWPNDGIVVDFAFGGADPGFTPTDAWTITANGAGMIEFSSAHDNTNQFSTVGEPVAATANTSGGTIAVNSETTYDDEFDRNYTLYCSAAGGAAPNRTATIQWTGYDEIPFSEGSFSLVEATAPSLAQQLLEKEIYFDFAFGTEHALADTTNAVTAADTLTLATALTLATNLKAVMNPHDANTGGVWHVAGAGTHQIAAADPVDLMSLRTICIEIDSDYASHVADLTMHIVADTQHTLNTSYTPTTSSLLSTLVNFLNDAKAKYDAHRVSVGLEVADYWTVSALADRREYTAKDDRSYEITINTVNAGTSVVTTWNAKTYEGSWASLTLLASGGIYPDPYLDLPDNIRLMFRNVDGRFAANDVFTFSATSSDVVDWSLVRRETEIIGSGSIQQDISGVVTGVPLAYFIILNETPTSVLRVKESASGTHLSYSQVTSTPYIYFATDPGVDVQVDYEWRGAEPDPGNSYFATANRKRADIEFNEAIRYLTRDEARDGLYPSAATNDLWIMAEIAFETSFFGGYFIQVQSPADNEVFSLTDYRNAVDASETKDEISDVIVLNFFDALGYTKLSVEQMNDPFVGKNRLMWVGTPTGTAVGDDSTTGTLIYAARNTLQFSPNSQGKGNIIMMSNNAMTRTQALEDGSTTLLSLDGSFLAGHAAALTASFTDPANTILKRDTAAFDTITLFTERETQLLGGASINYMNLKGSGLYEYGESITVDTTEVALNEISARTQEHFVLKRIRQEMNDALIALVPPSPSAGVLMVQNQLVQSLGSMASANIIAPYGSDEGTIRLISPTLDVFVYVDELDARLYHFGYFFITRLPIKRLFGLYSVNTRFWDNRSLAA
ncbi:hypothetical protein LCGC14_0938540 [marine sediment metagenome]|uniref:Uncharacterized protein n=1 Tax=marine sediment metagenome TaxID=412755 RepID=A0A0F9RS31_9ZZZZ